MFRKVLTYIGLTLFALWPPGVTPFVPAAASRPDSCPQVVINAVRGVEAGGRKYALAATISGGDPAVEPTYKWCISAGKITKGKGTSSIEIDAADVKGEGITVTVMIGGFPWPCDNVATYKITLPDDSKP